MAHDVHSRGIQRRGAVQRSVMIVVGTILGVIVGVVLDFITVSTAISMVVGALAGIGIVMLINQLRNR